MNLRETTLSMQSSGVKAVVPFFTAGFPDEKTFLDLLACAARAGCRVIEIGIPFSDPIADGPVIQASSQVVLENGMTLEKSLALVREASMHVPAAFVVMGYMNPLLRMGLAAFAGAARESGVSGAIVADLPLEESDEVRRIFAGEAITLVDLVTPLSGPDRVDAIARRAEGFLYLVSFAGVTGAEKSIDTNLEALAAGLRERSDVPLYVGFGISTRDNARQAVRQTDGVIIGSALIRIIQASASSSEAVAAVESFLQDINQAVNNSRGSELS